MPVCIGHCWPVCSVISARSERRVSIWVRGAAISTCFPAPACSRNGRIG